MRQTDKGKNETSEIYNDNNAKVKFIDFCLGWQKNQGLSLTDTHTHTFPLSTSSSSFTQTTTLLHSILTNTKTLILV